MNLFQRFLASIQTKSLIATGFTPIGQLKEQFEQSKLTTRFKTEEELTVIRKGALSKGSKYPKSAKIRVLDTPILQVIEEAFYVYRDLNLKTSIIHCLEPNKMYNGFNRGKHSESLSLAYASNLTDALSGNVAESYNEINYMKGMIHPDRLIHVPAATFFRSSHFDFLQHPIVADVIVMPSVNVSSNEVAWKEHLEVGDWFYQTLRQNMFSAFSVALAEESDVVIIEGGLGGTYGEIDYEKVKEIFDGILNQSIFKYGFKYVIFAMPEQSQEIIDKFSAIRK